MRLRLSKTVWFALLFATLFCGIWRFAKASSIEPCAYAGGDQGGGCQGCWTVATGNEYGISYTLQVSCVEQTGDSVCFDTWSYANPSPACEGDTTACGPLVNYFLVVVGNLECSGDVIATGNSGAAIDYINAYFEDDPEDTYLHFWGNWVQYINWLSLTTCSKGHWDVSDTTTTANCSPP